MSEKWTDRKILESYEPGRLLSKEADDATVNKTFYTYIAGNGPVLEVGSGDGALSRNLNTINQTSLVQLDGSQEYNAANKKLRPRARIVTADMLSLPFAAETFEAAVGLNSLDTVIELDEAVADIKRVLKPGGVFIHFMNLPAQPETFMRRQKEEGIPFPLFTEQGNRLSSIGMQYVQKEKIDRLIKESESLPAEVLRDYTENYLERYSQYFIESFPLLKVMGDFIKSKNIAHTTFESITEEFQKQLGEILNAQDFQVIFNGAKKTTERVMKKRTSSALRNFLNVHGDNIILNSPEGYLTATMEELKENFPDIVYIIGIMNITVATKK